MLHSDEIYEFFLFENKAEKVDLSIIIIIAYISIDRGYLDNLFFEIGYNFIILSASLFLIRVIMLSLLVVPDDESSQLT